MTIYVITAAYVITSCLAAYLDSLNRKEQIRNEIMAFLESSRLNIVADRRNIESLLLKQRTRV